MAYMAYMTINGSKQGKFKGNSGKSGRHGWIELLSFSYSVQSPRDAATGQASGKRQHKPVSFGLETGSASQQLFQALVSNEVLTDVLIEFVDTNKEGKNYVRQTIKLTNATVSNIRPQAFVSNGTNKHGHSVMLDYEMEKIPMAFHAIEWTWVNGGKTASDDWEARP
jgi:type VI secretion system secreted protein Hcp